jgi:hypothetical protein
MVLKIADLSPRYGIQDLITVRYIGFMFKTCVNRPSTAVSGAQWQVHVAGPMPLRRWNSSK